MLSGDGNEDSQNKLVGLISKKKKLCTCRTLFLYISLPLFAPLQRESKFPCYTFYGGNFVCVLVHFSFTAASFHLGGR